MPGSLNCETSPTLPKALILIWSTTLQLDVSADHKILAANARSCTLSWRSVQNY
jgi:hypothetical protein